MKAAIILLIVAICFTPLCVLCWITHDNQVETKVVSIEGHKYIILDTNYGADIIHAESCNCKSK